MEAQSFPELPRSRRRPSGIASKSELNPGPHRPEGPREAEQTPLNPYWKEKRLTVDTWLNGDLTTVAAARAARRGWIA